MGGGAVVATIFTPPLHFSFNFLPPRLTLRLVEITIERSALLAAGKGMVEVMTATRRWGGKSVFIVSSFILRAHLSFILLVSPSGEVYIRGCGGGKGSRWAR